ncbi:MAG: ABC-type Na+ efflux pump permease subunit, partial [Salinirussus sp.]
MVAVSVLGGIKYGFRLIGYALGVLIVGIVIAVIGFLLLNTGGGRFGAGPGAGQLLLSAGVVLLGILIIFAGVLGSLYKVVADGVERGNRAAEDVSAATTPQQPPQGTQGQQPTQGNQR